MENAGVIKKIDDQSEWMKSLVIMEKPNKTLTLCLDPRDLNKFVKGEQLPTFEDILTRLAGATHFTKQDANREH